MNFEEKMEAAIGDTFRAGGKADYFCIQGLWIAPEKYPGLVSYDCVEWHKPSDADNAKIKDFMDAMIG